MLEKNSTVCQFRNVRSAKRNTPEPDGETLPHNRVLMPPPKTIERMPTIKPIENDNDDDDDDENFSDLELSILKDLETF